MDVDEGALCRRPRPDTGRGGALRVAVAALAVALTAPSPARAQDAASPEPPASTEPIAPALAAPGPADPVEAPPDRLRALEERLRALEARRGGEAPEAPAAPAPAGLLGAALSALEGVEVHGAFAGGYVFNAARPPVRRGANRLRVSDLDHDTFSPTLAKLGLSRPMSGEGWDAGFALEVAAGTLVPHTLSADPDFLGGREANLANAWIGLQVPTPLVPLTVKVGRRYGWFGIDSLDVFDAPLYSLSWFGNYTPFTNTGVFLELEPLPGLRCMQYVGNGAEVVRDHNRGKTVGGQLVWSPADDLELTVNWIYGAERPDDEGDHRWQLELVASWQATPSTRLRGLVHYGQEEGRAQGGGTAKFGGASLALRQGLLDAAPDPGAGTWERLALLARTTWYRDQGGVNTGLDQGLLEGSVGLELAPVPWAWLRLEVRHDASSADGAFVGRRGQDSRRAQTTVALAASLAF